MAEGTSQRLFGRDFVLLWQGQLVSQLGNQAFLVATMSWTLEATSSPGLVGLLLMASTLPAVGFGPVAGAIADRHSRRALIVAADLLRALGHLGLAVVLAVAPGATGLIVPLLIGLGFVSGVLGALSSPALTAAIPDLVPPRRLAAANSAHQMSSQAAALVGQAAGGLGYTWIGASGLVLFDGITFVFSAACAALARVPQPSRPTTLALRDHATVYLRDVREGLGWLWQRPLLRSLILAFGAVNFLFTPVFVLLPVYVKDVLGRGPEWYGYLLAAAGGGAMAGVALAGAAVPAGLGLGGLFGGLARPALTSLIVVCGAGIVGVAVLLGIRRQEADELQAAGR